MTSTKPSPTAHPGGIELFHGYTYSGHPAACAAGLATQQIYEDEDLFGRADEMSEYFLDAMWTLKDLDIVTDIRGMGMLVGVDVAPDGAPGARGTRIQKRLFWNGMHVKFTGDCGIVAPQFIAEKSHIDEMVEKLAKTLKEDMAA